MDTKLELEKRFHGARACAGTSGSPLGRHRCRGPCSRLALAASLRFAHMPASLGLLQSIVGCSADAERTLTDAYTDNGALCDRTHECGLPGMVDCDSAAFPKDEVRAAIAALEWDEAAEKACLDALTDYDECALALSCEVFGRLQTAVFIDDDLYCVEPDGLVANCEGPIGCEPEGRQLVAACSPLDHQIQAARDAREP
jgi:hypothetical protein